MPVATIDDLGKGNPKLTNLKQPCIPLFKTDRNDRDFTSDQLSEGEGTSERSSTGRRRSSRPKPEIIHLPAEELSPPPKKALVHSDTSPKSKKRGNGYLLGRDPNSPSRMTDVTGLDRKTVEQERLTRLAEKGTMSHSEEHPSKRAKTETSSSGLSGPQQSLEPPSQPLMSGAICSETKISHPDSTVAPPLTPSTDMQDVPYPNGAIKRTWAFGYPRHNDIKIEEVLQKNDLRTAVLSSWQMDMEWIARKLDFAKTKLILVMECKNEADKTQWRKECQRWSKSLRLCFPPMGKGPYERMHSKLMLLFYPQSLRVVVPTANLMPYDWGETGMMENAVFLIDLPRLPQGSRGPSSNATVKTPFARELLRFLDAMQIDEDVKSGIHSFDFSNTSHLAFIHSISGPHFGDDVIKSTGYPLFASSVQELGLQSKIEVPLQIDVATSSVGALTEDRVEALYGAFSGHHHFPTPNSKLTSSKAVVVDASPVNSARLPTPLKERFRIFFPSTETIKQSRGGPDEAGTIFMTPSTWHKPGFPQHLFRDSVSTREGLLSHCKMILMRTPHTSYVYVGSANLSQSAWGNLTWDRKAPGGAKWKLNVGNWECGVLMKVRGATEGEAGRSDGKGAGEERSGARDDGGKVMSMEEAFGGVLDVPFEWPGKAYEDGDGRGGERVPCMQKGGF